MEKNISRIISLSEYYDLLLKHDWYYEYTDDHNVWLMGNRQHKELNAIKRQGNAYQALYDQFHSWAFSKKEDNIKKPIRPTDTDV